MAIQVETDLTPIANLAGIYTVLVGYPGAVLYGSAGVGSSPHLAAELLSRMAGVEFTHVPYRGGAPAMTDLIAGRVQFIIGNMPEFLEQIRAGALRAIAFGGANASPELPGLPLIKQWLPDYDVSNWFGFCGPGKLPAEILAAWNAALQAALADQQTRGRMVAAGMEILGGSVATFNDRIALDRRRWREVIRAAGISAG